MLKIAIITGSTRPQRKSLIVAEWVYGIASRRGNALYEIVDIADYRLPLFDEPFPPAQGRYTQPHTIRWAAKIAEFDGFVFVSPEYNHGIPGALKNAIDFLGAEWNNKPAGFVTYGMAGGARCVEQLRTVLGCLDVADVSRTVMLSLVTDFKDFSELAPDPRRERELMGVLDQVESWGGALKGIR